MASGPHVDEVDPPPASRTGGSRDARLSSLLTPSPEPDLQSKDRLAAGGSLQPPVLRHRYDPENEGRGASPPWLTPFDSRDIPAGGACADERSPSASWSSDGLGAPHRRPGIGVAEAHVSHVSHRSWSHRRNDVGSGADSVQSSVDATLGAHPRDRAPILARSRDDTRYGRSGRHSLYQGAAQNARHPPKHPRSPSRLASRPHPGPRLTPRKRRPLSGASWARNLQRRPETKTASQQHLVTMQEEPHMRSNPAGLARRVSGA